MPLLTKSKYLNGLQCSKYLWIASNEYSKIPEPDEATQHLFEQGHLVGSLAKSLFQGGIDIPHDDFIANIHQTEEELKKGLPVFEAGIRADDLYSRADILVPAGEGQWDIIEVKSATKAKPVNIQDLAFQRHVYQKSGLKIRKCFLMHINTEYVRQGEVDPKQLFSMEDLTEQVEEAAAGIEDRIVAMFNIMNSSSCPEISIGEQCDDPYECPLKEPVCWSAIPEDSVFDLYRGGKKSWELFRKDIVSIKDIPEGAGLSDKQAVQAECAKTGRTFTNPQMIQEFLERLQYPLYFLDFETINPVVPMFDKTGPYQQVPFQFSLHKVDKDYVTGEEQVTHNEFLHLEQTDPRPAFLAALKEALGGTGSIITYNMSFEIGRLREGARDYPEYQQWYDEILPRVVDLIEPFRNFHYHSPQQKGSNSLKAVLPALTGRSYSGLEINDGGQASRQYLAMIFTEMAPEEREKTRLNLLKYCGLDTEGMIDILKKLREA